jgi:CheY-like chemotaxis protein
MQLVTPRLLITDDDRDFRATVAGVLQDRGFETLEAGDGEEALQIISRHQVHLLLLDMQMPRLSGLETIERLRDMALEIPLGAMPVLPPLPPWILISGALDEQLIARARAASAFSVLPKPLRLPELTGAVASALSQAYGWRAA